MSKYAQKLSPYRFVTHVIHKKTPFDVPPGSLLPPEFRKFWDEWKAVPTPLHYVHKNGKYMRQRNGQIVRIQNDPIPYMDVPEENFIMGGGEAIIEGCHKVGVFKRLQNYLILRRPPKMQLSPKYWMPILLDGVVYSEVLNKHMSIKITPRAIQLINENFGLDFYLLKTPANDLHNLLSIKLKKKILLALSEKSLYPDNEQERQYIYDKYKSFLDNYTPEELEWYGLSFEEAVRKLKIAQEKRKLESIVPLKQQYRKDYVEKLKSMDLEQYNPEDDKPNWLMDKIFPFNRKK